MKREVDYDMPIFKRCLHVPLISSLLTGYPNFCRILANFRVPKFASTSFLAPVQTNLPDRKISAVHRGSRIRIITPWKRDGLYSEFLVWKLIRRKFRSQPRFTVATQFCILMELSASCGSVDGIGLCGTILHCGGSDEFGVPCG